MQIRFAPVHQSSTLNRYACGGAEHEWDHGPVFRDRFESALVCGGQDAESSSLAEPAPVLEDTIHKEARRLAGYPLRYLDTSTRPQEDFYQFAVGGYEDALTIPANQSSYGVRAEIQERVKTEILGIVDKAARELHPQDTLEQKIGDFYASGLDTAAIEARGFEPIRTTLETIEAMKHPSQLQGTITDLRRNGIATLFTFNGAPDFQNPDLMVAQADQGGLGLPKASYYTRNDDRSRDIREKYVNHMAKMFALTGRSVEASRSAAERVMALETRLAHTHFTVAERRDPDSWDNKVSKEELASGSKNFCWDRFLDDLGLENEKEIYLVNPRFHQEVDKALGEVPLRDWKDYLQWNVIDRSAALSL